jgi:hypothetical protein
MRLNPLCLIGALTVAKASRLKQWRRKPIVKRPPPLSNGGQIPTIPIWSFTRIEKSAYAFLEGMAFGAQLEEAIRAASASNELLHCASRRGRRCLDQTE